MVPPAPDADTGGLPDEWEQKNFGDLSPDATGDPDGDLMQNLDEYNASTDPNNGDSDADGLTDGEEVALSTNPLNYDTDNDGSSDFEQVQAGSDPVYSSSTLQPVISPVVTPPTDTGGTGTTNPAILLGVFGMFLLRRKRAIG